MYTVNEIFRYFGTLIGLSLCIGSHKTEIFLTWNYVHKNWFLILHHIWIILFLGLGFVNPHFYEILKLSLLRRLSMNDLGIPELYWRHWWIWTKNSKYSFLLRNTNTRILIMCQALQAEFLKGNRFDRLLPNLMKYFYRVNGNKSISDEISVMVDRKLIWLFFSKAASFLLKSSLLLMKNSSPSRVCFCCIYWIPITLSTSSDISTLQTVIHFPWKYW